MVSEKPVLCLNVLQEAPLDTDTVATMEKISSQNLIMYSCSGKTLVEGDRSSA